MKVSEKGIAFLRDREDCRLSAYRDGGGVWTIGVGHTGPDVHEGQTITQFEADELLRMDLEDHDISPLLGNAKTSQAQFDAMTSLAFNIGLEHFRNSTVLKRHKLGNPVGAANAFLLWHFDNGKSVAGLMHRRELERKLYLEGIYS
jgi:lysozyme